MFEIICLMLSAWCAWWGICFVIVVVIFQRLGLPGEG